MLKKAALSLFVIGASGTYVWGQSGTPSGTDLTEATPASAPVDPKAVATVAAEPPLIVREPANGSNDAATAPLRSATSVRVQSVSIDPTAAPLAIVTDGLAPAAEDTALSAAPVAVAPPPPRPAVETPKPIKVSAKAKPHRGLVDGTFDGPAVDAFYGLVQIEADVQNGKLVNIKVLQYPSDRRTSIAINRQALPILKLEAIAAQSANVDVISGATLTSEAFIESLGAALRQANT